MASATVSAPTALDWLAERGLVVGARVGSCVKPHHPFGTVIAINGVENITVRWDNATTTSETWSAIAPLGYTIEVAPVAASASVWASAAAHLDNRVQHVRIDGERFAIVTSGNSGRVYRLPADASECPCEWNTRTGAMCSHMLSVELQATMDELAAEEVAPLVSYRSLYPGCLNGCGELVERRGEKCLACLQVETRNQEIAEKRDAFGRVIPPFTLNELVA